MQRLGAIFIVICMVLIAGSVGAVLYLYVGLSGTEAAVVGLAVLTALTLHNTLTTRLRGRTDFGGQIADLSRGTTDLARQVAELGRRIATVEGRGDTAAEKARAVTAPVTAELGELGALVRQLAETVAAHEAKLAAGVPAAPLAPPEIVETDAKPATSVGAGNRNRDEITAEIASALDAGRVDLYLQPIVTLPQRKVRFYEALTRLRTADGVMLEPNDFLEPAEAAGLMPKLDQLQLFRSVQVVRRLLLKNRDVGLFCNISAASLSDAELSQQMAQFLEANRALAPSLVLEMRQGAWRNIGPLEQESLAALRDLGFRFCMDRVTDLRMEPRELGERGVRFIKAPAALLLKSGAAGTDIHVEDLAGLLTRYGISLIADTIETEAQVVDLLDYELKFGQGFLFSPPRPVRQEALQAAPDKAEGKETDTTPQNRPAASAAL